MKVKFNKETRDKIWALGLRLLPIVPGPELYDLVTHVTKSQSDFDKQVAQAVESLRNTSSLVSTLQQGVEEKMAKLQRLQQEHEKYTALAQIEAKKAEALLRQVETTLGRGQIKERWVALAMHLGTGLVFFILGVSLSDPFKHWLDKVWVRLFQ